MDGYLQGQFIRQISKDFFLNWQGLIKRELLGRRHSRSFLKTEQTAIFNYSSFYQAFPYLNKMDFQFLKVLPHSYYSLKLPFSIRKWAPLTGLSLLSVKPKTPPDLKFKTEKIFLLIPYLGAEMEFHFLFEKAIFKFGFSTETILNAFPFSVRSPFEWSVWLKGVF